jgi:hypothetical protein
MKTITRTILLLAVCWAGAAGQKRTSSETCVLRGASEPLSAQDIRSAFDILGLKIERFTCSVPAECKIRISLQKYIHGAAEGRWGNATYTLQPGQQQLTLFTREQDGSLTFTFEVEGGRISWDSMNMEGYRAKACGRLNAGPLEKGRAVPFYLFTANLNGIEGFSPDRPVEELTGKYALAVVFFVELL